jgi:hypothetical protein
MASDSSSQVLAPIYFVLVLLICTYFLINLVIAVFYKNWILLSRAADGEDSVDDEEAGKSTEVLIREKQLETHIYANLHIIKQDLR